jgi:hypothetical protein
MIIMIDNRRFDVRENGIVIRQHVRSLNWRIVVNRPSWHSGFECYRNVIFIRRKKDAADKHLAMSRAEIVMRAFNPEYVKMTGSVAIRHLDGDMMNCSFSNLEVGPQYKRGPISGRQPRTYKPKGSSI